MTRRATAFLGGAVVVGILAAVLSALLNRLLLDEVGYDAGVVAYLRAFVTAFLGAVLLAAPVLASVATRVPFAGVATAAVVALVSTPIVPLLYGDDIVFSARSFAYTIALVATVVVVDLVVLVHAGRPLPLPPVLLAALGTAALGVVVNLGFYATYGEGLDILGAVLRSWVFDVNTFVIAPATLVAAAYVGWRLGSAEARRPEPSALAAG